MLRCMSSTERWIQIDLCNRRKEDENNLMLMIGIKMFFDEKKKKTPYRLHQKERNWPWSLSFPSNQSTACGGAANVVHTNDRNWARERERESNCRRSRYLINSLMFARTRLMTKANRRWLCSTTMNEPFSAEYLSWSGEEKRICSSSAQWGRKELD